MPRIYLSIGSNIEREKHIGSALRELRDRYGELTISSVYETLAVGFEGPPFYNLVVAFESDQSFHELAATVREIEIRNGRTKKCSKFMDRTLDLDILLYGDAIIKDDKVQIPRDDIMRYAFVLEPLAEIAPEARHPVTQERFLDLWRDFDKQGLTQNVIDLSW